MRLVDKSTFHLAIDVLAKAYHSNPSVLQTIPPQKPQRLRRLFKLLGKEMLIRKALYITNDQQGVAAYYEPKSQALNLRIFLIKINLLFTVTGIRRGVTAIKRSQVINRSREQEDCLYFWLLAVHPDKKGIETIQEIRNEIFNISSEQKLPIYAETPSIRTKILYERYGFETYDHIDFNPRLTIWLMKRVPKTIH